MSEEFSLGASLVKAASEFIGTRFRLHGRDPATGLDCVGLVRASLQSLGRVPHVPDRYGLRNTGHACWFDFAYRSGFVDVAGGISAGDVLMFQPGPAQQHLIIAECNSVAIHAHAGLRRVVRQPITMPQTLLAHWRLT